MTIFNLNLSKRILNELSPETVFSSTVNLSFRETVVVGTYFPLGHTSVVDIDRRAPGRRYQLVHAVGENGQGLGFDARPVLVPAKVVQGIPIGPVNFPGEHGDVVHFGFAGGVQRPAEGAVELAALDGVIFRIFVAGDPVQHVSFHVDHHVVDIPVHSDDVSPFRSV